MRRPAGACHRFSRHRFSLRLPVEPVVERLDNGLTLCLLESRRVPLVVCALWYRVGARDEPPGQEGVAHFLEHMMFKGSPGYAEGEVDRRTQASGGSNNAFTTHDATAYHFGFASDRWTEALAIEADRMRELTLDAATVERERSVILEELAGCEDQPWDALEMAVSRSFFGEHPYGRPVVGSRAALGQITAAELRAFHRRHYAPDQAVLVLAGDLGREGLDLAASRFAALRPSGASRPAPATAPTRDRLTRVERHRGRVDRLLVALPAPAADHPDYAGLRLLATVMAGGRASRLQARLVEERRLCVWAGSEITEATETGALLFSAEATPGVHPERVEEGFLDELARVRREPPSPEEIERARRMLMADWVFDSERVGQQAMIVGQALALFDLDYPHRHLRRILECGRERLEEIARRYLRPRRDGVVGWSLARGPRTAADA